MTIKLIIAAFLTITIQSAYGQTDLNNDFNKAVNLLQSKDYTRAARGFTDVLNKAKDTDLIKFCYIYRAFSFNGLNEFKMAVADLDKAIEVDPEDLASYIDRGQAKTLSKDLEEAKKDFLFVLTKDSSGKQGQAALYYLAKIEFPLVKYQSSISYYDKLIPLNPKEPELYFNRGLAKGYIMDLEGAIKDYDMAIELKPDYMDALANRGVAKIVLLTKNGKIKPTREQLTSACADLQKAKQLGDDTNDEMISVYCK